MPGLLPDCFGCIHMRGLTGNGWSCDAFDQIPVEIMSRGTRHAHPIDGDGGIRFEAKKTQSEAEYCPVSWDDQKCDVCHHWIAENGCRIVSGQISPVGWCPGWQAATGYTTDLPGTLAQDIHSRFDSQDAGIAPAATMLDSDALPAAGVMIVTQAGRVLLLRRSDSGQWAFPGGKIEDGETSEEAALRECEEEIGRRPEIRQEWTRRVRDGVDFTTYLAIVPDEFEPQLNEEHTDYRWLPIEDLASGSMHELGLS